MAAVKHQRRKLSVPQLAEQLGVAEKKILGWIRGGELKAINLAASTSKRPRYAIDLADIAEFERRRAVVPTSEAAAPQLRRRSTSTVRDYF